MTAATRHDRLSFPAVFAVDLRSLGLFRIGLAVALLYDLWQRAHDLEAHYADSGLWPVAQVLADGVPPLAPHLWSGRIEYQTALFALAAACALLLALGHRTRVFLFLSWILHASLRARNPAVGHGGDDLLGLLLLWSIFLPMGARFSLDARTRPVSHGAGPYYSAAAAALLLQVVFMYVFTGLLKLKVPTWRDGSMLSLILENDWYVSEVGRWVAPQRWLTVPLTFGTLVIELCAPVVLLVPRPGFRALGLALLLGLQIGTALCMTLGIFPWVFFTALIPFVPTWAWEAACGRSGAPPAPPPAPPSRAGSALHNRLVWALVGWSLVINVASVKGRKLYEQLPTPVLALGEITGLDQYWSMFAQPETSDGWLCVRGTLADGTVVNLLMPEAPVDCRKPKSVVRSLPGARWIDALQAVVAEGAVGFWQRYESLAKRRWNAGHGPTRQLVSMEVVFFHEPIPAGRAPNIVRESLWPPPPSTDDRSRESQD